MTLFSTDIMFAQVEVAEEDLQDLEVGQEAEVLFEGEDESTAGGRVELISPYIDPKARTARVRVRVDNSTGSYIPGMFARIRIFVGEAEQKVTVPQRAIVTNAEIMSADKAIVFLVRHSRVFRREVSPGQREVERVVVLSGLPGIHALAPISQHWKSTTKAFLVRGNSDFYR
mgnify:CR=1 FL=1